MRARPASPASRSTDRFRTGRSGTQWTAPEGGTAVFNTRESNFDTVLAAYTGTTITGLTQRASNDQFNGSNQSKIVFPVRAGTTYRIAVDGFGATTGTVGLQWSIDPPSNDNFSAPRPLNGPFGIVSSSTVRTTGEPAELDYHGGAIADNSAWFSWTPSESGPARLRLGSVAGGLSPGIGVYTGDSLGALTSVAAGAESVSLNVVAGTTYRIAVDGNAGSTGTFTLEWLLARCNGRNATIVGTGAPIVGTAGADVIVGSAKGDVIDGGGGGDVICGLGKNDTLTGGAADDSITGGPGNDRESGGLGHDTFKQGAVGDGADRIDGETGTDTVDYGLRTGPLTVTLNSVANDGLAGEGDTVLASVENVVGGLGDDKLEATNAIANRLRGGAGRDLLIGDGGSDVLIGGPDPDRLFGETGADSLDLVDGAGGDRGDGGADTDTATRDPGDSVVNVP